MLPPPAAIARGVKSPDKFRREIEENPPPPPHQSAPLPQEEPWPPTVMRSVSFGVTAATPETKAPLPPSIRVPPTHSLFAPPAPHIVTVMLVTFHGTRQKFVVQREENVTAEFEFSPTGEASGEKLAVGEVDLDCIVGEAVGDRQPA